MIKLQGLSREQVREIASQTADAFYDYRYHDEDSGLLTGRCYADSPDIDGQVLFEGDAPEGEMVNVVIDSTEDGLLFGHIQEG